MRRPAWPSLGFSLLRRSSSRRHSRPRSYRHRWPWWASAAARAQPAGEGWPAKATTARRSRSLFGDVPVRVRRLLVCPCHGPGEPKSFAALDLGAGTVAPELAYVTAKFAALAPFGKVAALLSELLPISGAQNAGTVRNRTLRVGQEVVPQRPIDTAKPPAAPADGPSWSGLMAATCAAGTGRAPRGGVGVPVLGRVRG